MRESITENYDLLIRNAFIVDGTGAARYRGDVGIIGDFNNNKVFPCVDSIDDGIPVCGSPNGPLIFFGSSNNSDATQDVGPVVVAGCCAAPPEERWGAARRPGQARPGSGRVRCSARARTAVG